MSVRLGAIVFSLGLLLSPEHLNNYATNKQILQQPVRENTQHIHNDPCISRPTALYVNNTLTSSRHEEFFNRILSQDPCVYQLPQIEQENNRRIRNLRA